MAQRFTIAIPGAQGQDINVGSTASTGGVVSLPTAEAIQVQRGYQQIVEPTTVTALTIPANTTYALVQNNGTQPARYRFDGVDPTASLGMRLPASGHIQIRGAAALAAAKFIREAAGVTLDIQYYA
jgi:guanyl-specific ribonuclease Sa